MAELAIYDLMNISPVCDGNKTKPRSAHDNAAPSAVGEPCPHCGGRGFVATSTGRAIIEFLEPMGK